ncbi:hypothetical protein JOD29_000501 [Lysinibacillus composti]|uniref:Uncharacterized protein n=1 Tax=Lysinibacillus composti TaxID=720633 RepID=A0A3N9UJG4_9BACI|nr:hypothetical protein [Lysinibacillus composti]MBM7607264.1 hypothetical protein [Lysinibacillus composti]RQW76159.1 hypothetical protein EBB45_01010 [Lysinibacillus composti]
MDKRIVRLYEEEKFNLLYMYDLLIIYKLIESFTGERLPDEKKFYWNMRSDYVGVTDFWYPLEIFFDETRIGEVDYGEGIKNPQGFVMMLHSLKEAHERKEEMSEVQLIILENITEELLLNLAIPPKLDMTKLYSQFDEDNFTLYGHFEFGSICMHFVCKVLLEAHKECVKLVEGIEQL